MSPGCLSNVYSFCAFTGHAEVNKAPYALATAAKSTLITPIEIYSLKAAPFMAKTLERERLKLLKPQAQIHSENPASYNEVTPFHLDTKLSCLISKNPTTKQALLPIRRSKPKTPKPTPNLVRFTNCQNSWRNR
jgi:hypothetical protein